MNKNNLLIIGLLFSFIFIESCRNRKRNRSKPNSVIQEITHKDRVYKSQTKDSASNITIDTIIKINTKSILLCSWNIKDLGNSKSDSEINYISKLLASFDIVQIQEVVSGRGVLLL